MLFNNQKSNVLTELSLQRCNCVFSGMPAGFQYEPARWQPIIPTSHAWWLTSFSLQSPSTVLLSWLPALLHRSRCLFGETYSSQEHCSITGCRHSLVRKDRLPTNLIPVFPKLGTPKPTTFPCIWATTTCSRPAEFCPARVWHGQRDTAREGGVKTFMPSNLKVFQLVPSLLLQDSILHAWRRQQGGYPSTSAG